MMRLPIVISLILLCFATAISQNKPVVADRGNFGLHVVNDSILPLEILVLDEARTKTKTETKQAAWAIDLRSGKRLALLDRPLQIRTASWSKNGKTIMTTDAFYIGSLTKTLNVSFWDGETFAYRSSVTVENVTWTYLSNDGARFFAASGRPKDLLGIKYVADSDSVVRVWNTATGEVEKTIAVADAQFHPQTREIEISPDEKFLLMVKKHKSVSSEHRLLALEIDDSIKPKYELKPQPKIDDSRVVFSPDGKYFAVDVGRNLQIYETETGKLKVELTDVELPTWGWLDDETLASIDHRAKNFFESGKLLRAFDANDGRLLFKQRLDYGRPRLILLAGLVRTRKFMTTRYSGPIRAKRSL